MGKKKIPKTAFEITSLGALDELNNMIGVLKNKKISLRFKKILHRIQEDLFIIQAHAAAFMFDDPYNPPAFSRERIAWMEDLIEDFERKVMPARKFVIPGATEISAWLDLLRAKSRTVERAVLLHTKKYALAPEITTYLNRLSSLFFAMARMATKQARKKERHPWYH